MTIPVGFEVKAPKAEPPSSGLLEHARQGDTSDPHWEAGYWYRPELPVRTARNRGWASGTYGANIGSGEVRPIVEVVPYVLSAEDVVSTFEMRDGDHDDRMKRILKALSSHLLERELWTGEITQANSAPTPYLAHADTETVTPAGSGVKEAVGALLKAYMDCGMGPAMIHAPKDLAVLMPDAWRNEDTLKEHGFVVVSGSGYPGTGPGGTGSRWMYITEFVNYRLSDDISVSSDGSNINRADNTAVYRAERVGSADFAGPAFACQVQ